MGAIIVTSEGDYTKTRTTTWANRGSAADYAGKQVFFTDLNAIGYSDGTNWIKYEDTYTSVLPDSGAQVFDIIPTAVIPISGTLSSTASTATTISGYGGKFVTTSGLKFSHIRIRRLAQTTAAETDFWQDITVNVRAGDSAGAIVASGATPLTPYATSYSDVLVELFSSGVAKTLTEIDLGTTYWVEYIAINRDGGRAPIGFSNTTVASANQVLPGAGNTKYQLKSNGAWSATEGLATYYLAIEPYYYSEKLVIPASNQIKNDLILPPVYAVVGRECNIYFDGLIPVQYNKLAWDVTCTIGTQQNERFTVIPSVASASTSITISALDPATLTTVATKTGTIQVADAATAGTLKCLFIGDSTTASGEVVAEINVLDTADANIALTMLGTQGSGANLHEGRSGWSATTFTTTGSPFYVGGKIDFAGYMTANGYTGVDRIVINLGINDMFSASTDNTAIVAADTCVSNIAKLITSIQRYSATCLIGIALTTPPSFNQDAFGKNYTSAQNYFRFKRNITILYSKMLAKFSGLTTSKIWLIPYNVSIDTENNMITENVPVNSRNSMTVTRQSNGVHPAASGYQQIADTTYAWIKCTL